MFRSKKVDDGDTYPEYSAECARLEALPLPELAQDVFERLFLGEIEALRSGYNEAPMVTLARTKYPSEVAAPLGMSWEGARLEKLLQEAGEILIQSGLAMVLRSDILQPTRAGIEALQGRTTASRAEASVSWAR